jgi:hypothetical protein
VRLRRRPRAIRHDPEAGRRFAESWKSLTAPSITCPVCGMTSYNPNDVREGYCGNCHAWTGPNPPATGTSTRPYEQP